MKREKAIVVVWGIVTIALFLIFGKTTSDGKVPLKWEKIPAEPKQVVIEYEPREFTETDAQILMRIAEAEAENQHTEGRRKIMEVVLNRVASPLYPDTIEGVVFQENAFTTVANGKYYRVEISPQAHEALAHIEKGEPIDTEIVAFDINDGSDKLLEYYDYKYTVGCHNFYTEKKRG